MATESQSQPQPIFPQFALLPAELRLRIWRYAAPRRTIPVRLKQDLDAWNWASNLDWWMHYNVVPDGQSPSPVPAVLLVNTEARAEVVKQYQHPLRIDRDHVRRTTRVPDEYESVHDGDEQTSKSFDKMCDASSVRPFHPYCDVLEWAETWRWHRDAMTNTTPLFLGACLSVRHVSIEYALWMCGPLLRLAKAVVSEKHPTQLSTITVTINQPRERRQTQYRLAKRPPSAVPLVGGCPGTSLDNNGLDLIEEAIENLGAFLPESEPGQGNVNSWQCQRAFAVFQVMKRAEFRSCGLAEASLKKLCIDSKQLFETAYEIHSDSTSGHDDKIPRRLLSDLAEWCGKLNQQAVDPFSRTLAVDFTIPSHGLCTPEYGLPGSPAEAWTSRCLRQTDWDKLWARRGTPSASSS